ncbi:glycosyltransferase family A protein [Sphingobacterium oryzagri]|uniref:Glycosyltransferase family A protein n=1 Tax=Sphingobacterium oryzagri TaxID=3025669 RepID=A0ABY7WD31_9SPHI|nr:glycosyltransferase family A protein [Sphingobacterium sp. KACC 22765]WDF67103.1 glycosyltransferase family A protein [Sphingobacterium sp. KACC 22765]
MLITLTFIIFLFFFLQLAVAIYNCYKKPYLKPSVETSSRRVSILIPARNEAENLGNLLESLAKQSYDNFEIIILDDSSDDDTYEIAKRYVPRFRDLKIIKGLPLLSGWTGKNYACAQLASSATGG